MKTKFLPAVILAIAISSCSTAYRTGQTPDDVYYSPARNTYIIANKNYDENNYENSEILMSIRDPRWRSFDYDYGYSPYLYGYNSSYYYNPCYYPYPVYVLPYNTVNSTPRMTNLSAYKSGYNNINSKTTVYAYRPSTKSQSNYNNGSTGFGNTLREIFSSSTAPSYNNNNTPSTNNNSNNNSNNSDRNYTPSSSSNGSSSSGGGGSSRPARAGR